MRPHLQYLAYVVRHKWFVFRAGLRTGAPLWRLLVHDWSKFTPAEWGPYVRKFYGGWERLDEFDQAWLHHQHHNPHHWQHWLLREDSGLLKLLRMPDDLVREMVADWMGAGRAIRLPAGTYVVTTTKPCHVAHEQHYLRTGTVQLTIKEAR